MRSLRTHLRAVVFRFYGKKDDTRDRAAIVRITSAVFIVTLILSWRAYIHSLRIFSISPVIEIFGLAPAWFEWGLFAVTLGFLGWLVVTPLRRVPALGVLACVLFWILQDLMRFQPYTYMYFFTIWMMVFCVRHGLEALRIMVCGVYFWAGFHKFNMTFYARIFPWFVAPFYRYPHDQSIIAGFMTLILLSVPLFEASIGILLFFFPRQRLLASLMAFVMLVVVMACLGPYGHNWAIIVWPWNIYLFLVELVLFCKTKSASKGWSFKPKAPVLAAIVLFVIAPAYSMIGLWPSYPSFKLFSGNTKIAYVVFSPEEKLEHLPEGLGKMLLPHRRLALVDWTAHEFNVQVYPEAYVFQHGAKGLCPYLEKPQDTKLRIYQPPPFYDSQSGYTDFPLCS